MTSLGELENWEGGFPGEHEFTDLESLEQDPHNPELEVFLGAAQQLLSKWQGNKFTGLYLYGTEGTGKTHAAIGLGRVLSEAGAEVHYRFLPNCSGYNNHDSLRGWDASRSTSPLSSLSNFKSVFPVRLEGGLVRNPKSVVILDDYRPENRRFVIPAVEAAAQYGGLVIMTSNYDDPFKLLESGTAAKSADEIMASALVKELAPEEAEAAEEARKEQEEEISASFRSRIAAAFKTIQFKGPDRRISQSFWK